jgi:Flp pilus assembly protein TadB
MILYVAARLTFPDTSEPQDLRAYFAEVSGRLWMLVGGFYACAFVVNVWLIGTPLLSAGPLSQLFLCLYALTTARLRRDSLQVIGLVLLTVQLLWRATALAVHS